MMDGWRTGYEHNLAVLRPLSSFFLRRGGGGGNVLGEMTPRLNPHNNDNVPCAESESISRESSLT